MKFQSKLEQMSLKNKKPQQKNNQQKENTDAQHTKGFSFQLEQNISYVKEGLGNSSDLVTRTIIPTNNRELKLGILYIDGLIDNHAMQNYLMETLMVDMKDAPTSVKAFYPFIKESLLPIGELKEIDTFEKVFDHILSGDTVLFVNGELQALALTTKGWKDRGVNEPTSESVIRGPKEGFTETLRTNTALLRRKIKDPNLRIESKKLGRMTKTDIAIVYLHGTADEKVVEEVHKRLDDIDVDGILESGYIEEFIEDDQLSPFPTTYNSERPDTVAASLLEGRVAIITDGTPFVLIVPALFVQFFQANEDYYQRFDISTAIRILRFLSFILALLMPSLYIAATTFHQEMIPAPLLISLAAQREGVPFPAFIEALLMELTFEILREAGVRMPRAVGGAISIVGALVLGEAAVQAGLVSPAMVIVVSITAIASFVIPAFNMSISIRMLRFVFMGLAASFGLFGIILGLIATSLHLCSLKSFGIPYMSPLAPIIPKDQKDVVIRFPHWGLFSRPTFLSRKNEKRSNTGFKGR
ncbi:spore germination protein [Bacillus tianshenii]|nr:spore germination protein [Bacillus tianshenii]